MIFLEALACKNKGRVPVWIMRQAGRYLPSYQLLRKKHPLKELFFTPELAARVTLLPFQELELDAAICFSDILVIVKALGFSIDFLDKPVVSPLLTTEEAIDRIFCQPLEESLFFLFKTLEILKKELSVPLIGFCGGAFTVATYLMKEPLLWLYQRPDSFHRLLEKLTEASIEYVKKQIESGADVIQIFESHANLLPEEMLLEFVFPYLGRIVDAVKSLGAPVILFMRGSSYFVPELLSLRPTCISLDWHRSLQKMREKIPYPIAIQGNFDPHLLFAPKEKIVHTVKTHLLKDPGYIANLGHGVLPGVSVDAVKSFIEGVRLGSAAFNGDGYAGSQIYQLPDSGAVYRHY